MKILVTGAKGFVGKNLCQALCNVRDGKDKTRGIGVDLKIFEYDLDTDPSLLDDYCKEADFVFNLAGVNRPQKTEDFMEGNFGFVSSLIDMLRKHNNKCPIMLSSSLQATLVGRYADGDYGKSKKAGEDLLFNYSQEENVPVYVFRFPNIFGKWCRPNYNSAVATFCNSFANDLPITMSDRDSELALLYIDDLVDEMFNILKGKAHRCEYDGLDIVDNADGSFCYCPVIHNVTLGEIVDLLESFRKQPSTLVIPEIPDKSFAKKLYSTYLSYLPKEKAMFSLKMNIDDRGSFTELFKSEKCGQVSVNISKPGITKGQHWHNTKWEFFIVVSGEGLIQQRKIGTDEILDFYVNGEEIQAVHMLPGYTHSIINLSETKDLVTVMWANEQFDPNKSDTFSETVDLTHQEKI